MHTRLSRSASASRRRIEAAKFMLFLQGETSARRLFMAPRYSYGACLCKRKLRGRRKSLAVHEGGRGRKEGGEGGREKVAQVGLQVGVTKVGPVTPTRTQVWLRSPTPLPSSSPPNENTTHKRKWPGKRESRVRAMICVRCLQRE